MTRPSRWQTTTVLPWSSPKLDTSGIRTTHQKECAVACPHFHPAANDPVSGITQGLCQCDKYNTNPLRPVPPGGEEFCQEPGASGVNCWLDLRGCKRAQIARRFYAYTIGDPYAGAPPRA